MTNDRNRLQSWPAAHDERSPGPRVHRGKPPVPSSLSLPGLELAAPVRLTKLKMQQWRVMQTKSTFHLHYPIHFYNFCHNAVSWPAVLPLGVQDRSLLQCRLEEAQPDNNSHGYNPWFFRRSLADSKGPSIYKSEDI